MAAAPPTAAHLEAVRTSADRFVAELNEEYYRHFAGLKEDFDLAPIYERHAELASIETAQAIGASVNGDRGRRELWRFTCEGYLGSLTRELEERAARTEAQLEATVDGETVAYRMLRPTIANEPDHERRRRLNAARVDLVEEHLNPLHLELLMTTRDGVRQLGASTYLELYRERFGMELDGLADGCRALLDSTERVYEEHAEALFRRRLGFGLEDADYSDFLRVFRAPEWDQQFRGDRMLPALGRTLGDLGIELRAQRNVELDVEQRPLKTPRAFCAPIEVPGRVVLVIQPTGGVDDWRALFHEAGHTEHFANTSPDLGVEARRLGDGAVSEGWAALFEYLVNEPAWLSRSLELPLGGDFAREAAVVNLFYVRRYCAKLLYELEFHVADDVRTMQPRYVELLADAVKVEPKAGDYLSDIDAGFYVSYYLRSWAFEAQLREFLRGEFGDAWFASREAGSLLRELWSLGQGPTAEELLKDVTGSSVELESVGDRIRDALR